MPGRNLPVALLLAALLIAGCGPRSESAARIQSKAEEARSLIVARAQSGADVSSYLQGMEQVKARLDDRQMAEGEALLDRLIAELNTGGDGGTGLVVPGEATSSDFGPPQPVALVGYDEAEGVMEPFISRDGRLLLFNSQNRPGGKPDLHHAERIDDRTFRYLGPVTGANSEGFDGGPSMDRNDRLYFMSPRVYEFRHVTIHRAEFRDGRVEGVSLAEGDMAPERPGWLNMDAEISADGRTLYYCVNEWNTDHNIPKSSDLRVAHLANGRFNTAPGSEAIFAALNTADLEYAPSLSADEREIFFTRARFDLSGGQLRGMTSSIHMATRSAPGEPFGEPRRIASITGLVEGPTLAPDGRTLYYHRKEGGIFRLYMVQRR